MHFVNHSWNVLEFLYYLSPPVLVVIAIIGLKSIKHTKDQIKLVSEELGLAKKQLIYQVEKDSAKTSIELTKYYIEEILPQLSKNTSLIKGSDYFREVTELDYNLFYDFNQGELFQIIQAKYKCQPMEVFKKIEHIKRCMNETLNETIYIEKDGEKIGIIEMPYKILLNKIEYFCMNFTTSVADEETVYRAIHQTFLAHMRHLYFPIALENTHPKDKLYNNIIELYQKWKTRDRKLEEEYSQAVEEQHKAVNSIGHNGKKVSSPI
ncbi:DUF4760 domain-containing protein [Desulfosporosinus sp. PR]|uniref:DUF4760 domain-containing protein n=1 Tax=Candidatus Desulfosporosinus nitrosoreducens TaxID=3401928 RepID=UPI0027FAA401|nr:DUF4760 domain-containing protein [Desulfosporosinus sp. PR]MDQ7094292.1 DUF4760 domain-containing protein [Desulfosporosinus sp. PR]